MTLKQAIEAYELLDSALVDGDHVAALLHNRGLTVETFTVEGDRGRTDFVRAVLYGERGKRTGGDAPTLGIIGRLGGIGARPTALGLVSDADGAITAITCALKLADLCRAGDRLPGDVVIATHICPHAPTEPHEPVPFMGSPVDIATMNRHEVADEMDAILCIDTTRGNWVINQRGFAISPTVMQGWILKVSADLLRIMSYVTGRPPVVFPLSMQDITPYGNGVDHLNSILQPATATDAPVVGVALTAEIPVPGCATGASQIVDIEAAARFCVEVAKAFTRGECQFYDPDEFRRLVALYGEMRHLQTMGREDAA
ncbi:MAG: DUF1177 domain-containing protein [Chloroflexi bacterium]|nr:DUF1177 domain-containing protein [Chloroflexota bacterium]